MSAYEVWATNDLIEWTQCILETDSRSEAFEKAQEIYDLQQFKFIAIDRGGKTIWSNDPDTPIESR